MEPATEEELRQFAPGATSDYISAIVIGWPEIKRAGIDKPERFCEFLGQFAHETAGFTIVRENTSWTPEQMCRLWPSRFKTKLDPRIIACGRDPQKLANLAYGSRSDLGNEGGNDGWRYRGGSFCQLTGRAAYREAGQSLGLPLEDRPELIERAEVGLRVAVWYWTRKDCNRFADHGYTRAVGNAINRGNPYSGIDPIGAEGRQRWRDRAIAVFGDEIPQRADALYLGAYGSQVEVLQRRLKELNYSLGQVDKVFGPAVADAVASFKLRHKRATGQDLDPDEMVGPATWAALNAGEPIVYANRQDATVADLKAAGSETAVHTEGAQKELTALTLLAGAKAAQDNGAGEIVGNTFGWFPQMQSQVLPIAEALGWALKNLAMFAIIVLAAMVWRRHGKIIAARLRDFINGFNLNR